MAKPGTLPRWADVGGGAGGIGGDEPLTGEKDTGWFADQEPPAAYMNWLQYWTYKWCQYLDGIEAEALNFTAGVTFTGVTATPGATGTAAAHASGVGLKGLSSATSGSVGVWGVGTAAGTRGLKVTHSIANEYMAAFLSTGSSTTLVNGLEIDAVYGGKAIDAATTKAALSGTATYAVKGYVEDSGTAATKDDYGIYGTGGSFLSSGVLGVGGSATGINYGVRGTGGNVNGYGVYATGFNGGTLGGYGLVAVGGTGSTTAGDGARVVGGQGTTNGDGGIGLDVSGGEAAIAGIAGAAIKARAAAYGVGGSAGSVIVTNNDAAGFDATDLAYGLELAAGHEIKFAGTRTVYDGATDALPNTLTASNLTQVVALALTHATVPTLYAQSFNAFGISNTSGGARLRITFTSAFASATYACTATTGSSAYSAYVEAKTSAYVELSFVDNATGLQINANSVGNIDVDILCVGRMA